MKVKIGSTLYDSEVEPIMLILSAEDKSNISNMLPQATKYCSFPGEEGSIFSEEYITNFMETT